MKSRSSVRRANALDAKRKMKSKKPKSEESLNKCINENRSRKTRREKREKGTKEKTQK